MLGFFVAFYATDLHDFYVIFFNDVIFYISVFADKTLVFINNIFMFSE